VPNFQTAANLAKSGKLGKIHTLRASVYKPVFGNSWLPSEPTPPRDVVDWNLWLGPAPWRPYNSQYVAGKWRGLFDFDSGGRLLDWGAHTVDLCQWANDADNTMPIRYEASDENIICHYANGVKLEMDFLAKPFGDRGPNWITSLGTCPVQFIGEEGWVETGDEGEIEVSIESLKKEIPAAAKRVKGLDVSAHSRNFFDSVKSRQPTAANAGIMRHSHTACHAASLSWLLNRPLTFDPAQETFNDDEADRLRSRTAREWT
jgi:predicted dehydrogenase